MTTVGSAVRQLALLVVVSALSAAALSGLALSAPEAWEQAPAAEAPEASPGASDGCSPARAHAAGDFTETIDSGGLTRQYRLHVPPSYDGTEAVPLVLLFHGAGGTDEEIAGYTGLPAKADEAGFIAVMPLGTVGPAFPGRIFNFLTFIPGLPDDVAFTNDLLNALESQLCIHASRIFSTGLSNGAMMSVRLACNLSRRIAAIVPVAGVYFPPFSPDLTAEPGCTSTRPVPVLAFHGTADDTVPFEGGTSGDLPISVRHIEDEVLPDWAAHNGCDGASAQEQVTEHVRLVQYENCDADATVALYAIDGGDHVWPGAEELPGPDVTDEISANDLLWDFFQAHPLTAAQAPAPAAADPASTAEAAADVLPTQQSPRAAGLPAAGGSDGGSGLGAGLLAGIAVAVAVAGAIALGGAAWWVRRRRLR